MSVEVLVNVLDINTSVARDIIVMFGLLFNYDTIVLCRIYTAFVSVHDLVVSFVRIFLVCNHV